MLQSGRRTRQHGLQSQRQLHPKRTGAGYDGEHTWSASDAGRENLWRARSAEFSSWNPGKPRGKDVAVTWKMVLRCGNRQDVQAIGIQDAAVPYRCEQYLESSKSG